MHWSFGTEAGHRTKGYHCLNAYAILYVLERGSLLANTWYCIASKEEGKIVWPAAAQLHCQRLVAEWHNLHYCILQYLCIQIFTTDQDKWILQLQSLALEYFNHHMLSSSSNPPPLQLRVLLLTPSHSPSSTSILPKHNIPNQWSVEIFILQNLLQSSLFLTIPQQYYSNFISPMHQLI